MFQKKLFFIISLLCFNGQAWTSEAPRESGFFDGARDNARRFTDKYLGKGNFFREREEAEKVEEERNQHEHNNQQEYKPTIVHPEADIVLSSDATRALTDLQKNVLQKILGDDDLRNEMGLLLPHHDLNIIVQRILEQRSITPDDIAALKRLQDGVRRNLEDSNIFRKIIERSKFYTKEQQTEKLKKYHEIFDALSSVTEQLASSNNPAIIEEIRPITELFSDKFNDVEKLRNGVLGSLEKIEISTPWSQIALDVTLTIGTAIVCVLAVVVVFAAIFTIFDGSGSGGSSNSSNSGNWDFFWWQAGRSSNSGNTYHIYSSASTGRSYKEPSQATSTPVESLPAQPRQRVNIFGFRETARNARS